MDFKGADGQDYSIKYDMTEGKDDKFTIVRPDTTTSKKASDIAAIFKYNSFTVDEWFAWGMTADGRRKQANVIMAMLPDALQLELEDIDKKTNGTTGTVFESRKNAKAVYENKKVEYAAILYSDYEAKMLLIENYAQDTADLIAAREKALIANSESTGILVEQATLKANIASLSTFIARTSTDQDEYRQSTTKTIEGHAAAIEEAKRLLEEYLFESERELYENQQDLTQKELELRTVEEQIAKKVIVDIAVLDNDLLEREPYMGFLATAQAKKLRQDALLVDMKTSFEKQNTLTEELEILRQRKVSIIAEAKLPVSNISIEGNEVFYVTPEGQLLPFSEENISYAKGGLTVAQIMLAVNKDLPLLLIGKAAEYDNEALEAISRLATENNAIVILDRVIPENTELEIECYEGPIKGLKQEIFTAPQKTVDVVDLKKVVTSVKPFEL